MNECPYIVGNECDIDRCNAFFDKADLLDKVAEIFPKSFCTYCNQDACEGGMVGTIQECETIRMIKDVIDGIIEDMKAEVEEVRI